MYEIMKILRNVKIREMKVLVGIIVNHVAGQLTFLTKIKGAN